MPAILEKIKYKIKDVSAQSLIKISLFLNWPKFTVFGLWLASSRINPKCESQYTVLCLGRSIFVDDVNAMAAYGKQIRYIIIWRTYFQVIFRHFIRCPEEEKLTEENYYHSNYCREGKLKYKAYLEKMFPAMKKMLGFDAVLSGSFTYMEQQELANVCEENRTPVVTLFKEGIAFTASGAYERWMNQTRQCKFIGAKMLLYGNKIMEALSASTTGIPGLSPEKLKVVGAPRLDCYFTGEKTAESARQIVFFSFYSYNFYHLADSPSQLEEAEKRCVDFHKWVMNFAKNHKDFKVIIKTKLPDHYLNYVKEIYNEAIAGDKKEIDNLTITNLGDSAQMIKDSRAVMGFYSTTLMEAIVADKISISPYFGDIITDKPWDYFAKFPELINYVKTEADLKEYIFNPDKFLDYNSKIREEFLKGLIHIPDGRASLRAETAIIETIKEYKK